MLAVHVVVAPPSSVVVYTLVLVVPMLMSVFASEMGASVEVTALLVTPVPEGEVVVALPPGTS
jgi:hypothetical protein